MTTKICIMGNYKCNYEISLEGEKVIGLLNGNKAAAVNVGSLRILKIH